MKKIDLGQGISILANVGVIVGILLLTMELHQNNELMSIQARATAVEMQAEVWRPTLEQPDIAPLLEKDSNGEQLSPEEQLRLTALWIRSLYSVEFIFYTVPERRSNIASGWNITPGSAAHRVWTERADSLFGPEFVEFMNECCVTT